MYAFISVSPFIFAHQLGRPDYEVGIYPAILIAGVWLGSMRGHPADPAPADRPARGLGEPGERRRRALVFLGAVLTHHLTVLLAIGPMFVFGMGAGIASPAALTQAISVNPHVIGSASGLYGFSQMGVGAICTALVGLGGDPALTAAIILATRRRDRPGLVLDRAALPARAGIGDAPDRAAGVVGDQQRAVLGDRRARRAGPTPRRGRCRRPRSRS